MRYNGVVHRKLALLDSQVLKLEESLRDVSFGEIRRELDSSIHGRARTSGCRGDPD